MNKRLLKSAFFCLGAFALLALVIVTFGCGGVSVNTDGDTVSVCDQIPEDSHSVICEIAGEAETTPETVASVLKLANTGALAGDLYTAEAAAEFIDEIKADLIAAQGDGGITYADAVAYIQEKYNVLPGEVAAVFVVLTEFSDIDISGLSTDMLSDYDVGLILTHLEDQRAIVTLMGVAARVAFILDQAVA